MNKKQRILENFTLIPNTSQEILIFSIIGAALALQIFYYLFFYLKVALTKTTINNQNFLPVSVIICARNEEDNLKKYLPSILEQDYPNFEVIVVNDCSEDESETTLAYLKQKYPHLYYTTIPKDNKFSHGKKLALTIGIKAAKNEILLFTDADCYPASNSWIKLMASQFSSEKHIVLGFGNYEKRKGFTNLLLRYDTFTIAMQYLGFALRRLPYMGVGRNMAYKKSFFNQNNGFRSHMHITSGDDDLFINENANKTNTAIQNNADSSTLSIPPITFNDWRHQKSRHLTTANHYKKKNKILLLTELFSRELIYFSLFYCIFFHNFVLISAFAVTTKLVIQLIVQRKVSKKIGARNIYWSGLLFDFLLPIILSTLFIGNQFSKKRVQWK